MFTKTNNEDSEKTESSVSESIEWNRITTIIATIVVLFFFTRSAPFPSSIYWELTIARDFDINFSSLVYPEKLALNIVNSGLSLLGLKSIYHILFFILCSVTSIWVFKCKESLPGLILLSIFAFTMQLFLNLRMLITLLFIIGILYLFDRNMMKNKPGIIFIPIMAAASCLGLNTLLLLLLIICNTLCNKKYKLSMIFCALAGGLCFPEGLVAPLDSESILNWNFLPPTDLEILYAISGLFLLINLLQIKRMSKENIAIIIFYAISGIFSFIYLPMIPIFIFIGLFLALKLFTKQKPLPLNYQMFGLLFITTIVYTYLFLYPFGIKLNPSPKNQLGKKLTPLTEGFSEHLKMPIHNYDLGELAWKGLIHYDQDSLKSLYFKENLVLMRAANSTVKVVQQKKHQEVDF